jgi:hypothetical protein
METSVMNLRWIPACTGMGGRVRNPPLRLSPNQIRRLQYLIRNIIISALLTVFVVEMNKVEKYIEKVRQWACAEDKISALALVGSHARQQARPDSDIDFVIISDDVAQFEKDFSWITRFGPVKSQAKEKWGSVTAIRVFYADGQEIEFGLASKIWVGIPTDAGTDRVVKDGMVILKDPDKILGKLK